jgi:hypothetical protein
MAIGGYWSSYHRWMSDETFDPRELALEKAASRAADAHAIATGAKTVEQVRRENSAFAFPRDRVRLRFPTRER